MTPSQPLPRDAQSILELAARSMFDLFANASEGMLLVDRDARVVWINDQYRRYLPALGVAREEDFVGHPVSTVVQNTQMHQVLQTGKPILIDLLSNRAGTFVVSRIPLRDAGGLVIGALGIVLFEQPQANLQPLIAKFSDLQRELEDARKELARTRLGTTGKRQSRYTFASFVGRSEAAVDVMVRVGGLQYTCDPKAGAGKRINNMTLNGKAIEADKTYKVAGWAPVAEGAKGDPIWDVMEAYFKNHKTISPRNINTPKLVGMDGNPGWVS